MQDGPNYEQVFTKMQVFHGGNPEDVKHIVRYLRFFRGQDCYEMYAKHYIPMLPSEIAIEFIVPDPEQDATKEQKIAEKPITMTVQTEVPKKKAGRPKKSK